ncbi:MAG: M20/M25/M40 family metallo-hydrolase [Nitrospira sp.]|nr:M20/M25/M40 family metallo-hydrolase [Nitrospira sp.]
MNHQTTTAQVRLKAHLHALVGERHPFSSTSFLQQAETYLYEQFAEAGLSVATQEFEALGSRYRNVVGVAHPPSKQNQPVLPPLIVAAHYDTVPGSPGADDNASALAVLLDVAQRITQTSLSRPVHFIAFCLEEEDLLGSRAYVSHLMATCKPVHGAIILECVGYARDEAGSQKIPPGVPVAVPTVGNFLAVIGNQLSSSLTMAVEQAMRSHLPVVPLIVPGNGELLPDTRRSDHTAFWEQGFPAVMVTDTANFRNPHYHRPTDTIDTLNLDFMAAVADGVTTAIFCLTETHGAP